MATIEEFNAAITAGDLDALARLITEDHRFVDSAGNEIVGREAVLAAWQGFFTAFPGYHNIFGESQATGEMICIQGASRCADPRLDGPALWRATLRDGQLAVWEVFDDTDANRADLGFASG